MNIIHDREKCIGCGSCVDLAPAFWRMSKSDGKATLLRAKKKNRYSVLPIDDFERDENLKASANCPVKIIDIR